MALLRLHPMIMAYVRSLPPGTPTRIEDGRQRKYKATGIVYDVKTIPPGATEKTDAIAVRLDHQAGYSVVVMIPYRLVDGQLVKGAVFAVKGDASIFPPLQ